MYQWNASDYATHSQGQEAWGRELMDRLNPREDDDILDVGCGDGRITAAIASRVTRGSVVGCDLSQDMIEHARRTYATTHPRLSFVQRDAGALGFESQFSCVFSNATLHWIRDQRPVVAGIARALRRGGRFVAQFGGYGNGQEVIDSFAAVYGRRRWRDAYLHFHDTYGFYRPEEYAVWLDAAAMEVSELRLIPKDMVHVDRAAFAGWLRTAWHPYTSPVTPALREAFIHEVVTEYVQRHPEDSSGRIHVQMVRLQLQAVKRVTFST
jgi:trans-aconitate 2-methyltransferase